MDPRLAYFRQDLANIQVTVHAGGQQVVQFELVVARDDLGQEQRAGTGCGGNPSEFSSVQLEVGCVAWVSHSNLR